ncbi:fungal-specific transcription factor domain-containing protein [Bisporella sp. PMI_857]|nr:fungal-specific transcription factor domain-containing protein [Bisporella sp. PMI_857]
MMLLPSKNPINLYPNGKLTTYSQRRSSPLGLSFGYDATNQSSQYNNPDGNENGDQKYRPQQDATRLGNQGTPSNAGFTALGALADFATARRSNSIQVPLRQPPPPVVRPLLSVSQPTSRLLFKTYFSTIHPMWPILYKPMYDLTGYDYLQDKIAPPLLYAIYSISACVQPGYPDLDENYQDFPSPQQSFEAALAALQQTGPLNLLKPSIDACQALTILALQQHGVAEDASAALLCSLASSMAIELKLHRATTASSDATDTQVRSRLWWNIYVLDKMLACEMGRPVHLRWEEQDNIFPSSSESDEYQLLSLRSSGQNRVSSVKTHTISGFHTTIQITVIMERISRQIYSIKGREAINERSPSAEETRARFSQDLKEYKDMMDALPLKLDPSNGNIPAPVTITNMVWMWCLTILLHRPFIGNYQPGGKDAKDPLQECFVAASNICNILEGYADNLPMLSCDLIFPIFTTASTLSYSIKQSAFEDGETRRRIDLCIRWLQVLGRSWKNASTRGEVLAQDYKPASRIPTPENHLSHNRGPQNGTGQWSMEDWSFLNKFSDPTDEFYAMDADFRNLLQGPIA